MVENLSFIPDSNQNKSIQGGNRIVFKLNDRNFKSKSKYEENFILTTRFIQNKAKIHYKFNLWGKRVN